MNNILGLNELQNISSIDQVKDEIIAQGYSVIRYNSWAISFCGKEDAHNSYRREILFTLTSGVDKEALEGKTVYGYEFKRHFVIRKSTNNPNAVCKIFVSTPQSLNSEAHWVWPRQIKENFDNAPIILCGEKPDYKGDGKYLDYKVLDYGGNIQNIPDIKAEYPVYLGKNGYLYEAYQEIPMFLIKSQKTKKKIKTIDIKNYERKFIMGAAQGAPDRLVIPKEITHVSPEVFSGSNIKENSKNMYTIKKMVMVPARDNQFIIRYVVLSGPRDGDLMCDYPNFVRLVENYNRTAIKQASIMELIALYSKHNKVACHTEDYMREYFMGEDDKISRRIMQTKNEELLEKVMNNFHPWI